MPILLDFKPQKVGTILRHSLGFNMEPFWFYGNFCLGGSKFCLMKIVARKFKAKSCDFEMAVKSTILKSEVSKW